MTQLGLFPAGHPLSLEPNFEWMYWAVPSAQISLIPPGKHPLAKQSTYFQLIACVLVCFNNNALLH